MSAKVAFADLGQGVRLRYAERGKGQALLCIMGFNASMNLWSEDFLGPLSERYRVITFDNRGVGLSTGPGPVSINMFAQDALRLLDYLGIEKSHVFGVSMGGMIAQQFAVDYAQRLGKLILASTTCSAKRIRPSLGQLLLLLLPLAPQRAMPALFSAEFLQSHRAKVDDIIATFKADLGTMQTSRQQVLAIRRFDLETAIVGIRAPTLVITGDADRIINAHNSDLIAARIKGSRLVKFAGAGHAFLVERAAESQAEILSFLESNHVLGVS